MHLLFFSPLEPFSIIWTLPNQILIKIKQIPFQCLRINTSSSLNLFLINFDLESNSLKRAVTLSS